MYNADFINNIVSHGELPPDMVASGRRLSSASKRDHRGSKNITPIKNNQNNESKGEVLSSLGSGGSQSSKYSKGGSKMRKRARRKRAKVVDT